MASRHTGWTAVVCTLVVWALGLGAGPAPAQTPPAEAPEAGARQPDERVRQALEAVGWKYDVDRDGDFRVIISWEEDGRSQLVFVNSATNSLGGQEVREVWSEGWRRSGDTFPPAIAVRLLEANASYKLGAWELRRAGGVARAAFTARIPANLPAEQLQAVISTAAVTADEMEKELVGTDDL